MPETRKSPYLFNNDITKTKPLMPDAFDLNRPAESGNFFFFHIYFDIMSEEALQHITKNYMQNWF